MTRRDVVALTAAILIGLFWALLLHLAGAPTWAVASLSYLVYHAVRHDQALRP